MIKKVVVIKEFVESYVAARSSESKNFWNVADGHRARPPM
jgi:hypothetical protein